MEGSDNMAAAKRKPPGKCAYETPEALEAACAKYFKRVDETGEVPSESGLALHLGVSVCTLHRWYDGESAVELQETARNAYNEMTVRYLQMLSSGNKNMTPFVKYTPMGRPFSSSRKRTSSRAKAMAPCLKRSLRNFCARVLSVRISSL